ncbi:bleomycin resistance protein [Flavobacterium sp. XGLA_31]|uniref:bleomycin resistance protein n=1 Tax=Flavobacterium sp. XGLA_31 TaxID=3447666 RepID=UPI003F31C322
MLTQICPKLPMRDKNQTKRFYLEKLHFSEIADYGHYLILQKDAMELHFFEFSTLDPTENYGQVYIRTTEIERLYAGLLENKVDIHPAGHLEVKPWGQKEFAVLDPDHNLLTFGQSV